jgi:prevent-host-death family protein
MPKAEPSGKPAAESCTEVTAREAKGHLGALLSRVGFGRERIAISRHGKRIAGLVSAADLDVLDALDAA